MTIINYLNPKNKNVTINLKIKAAELIQIVTDENQQISKSLKTNQQSFLILKNCFTLNSNQNSNPYFKCLIAGILFNLCETINDKINFLKSTINFFVNNLKMNNTNKLIELITITNKVESTNSSNDKKQSQNIITNHNLKLRNWKFNSDCQRNCLEILTNICSIDENQNTFSLNNQIISIILSKQIIPNVRN